MCDVSVNTLNNLESFLQSCLNLSSSDRDKLTQVYKDQFANSSQGQSQGLTPIRLVPFLAIYLVMTLFAVIGNGLVCRAVLGRKSMHSTSNLIIVNLAASDISLCLLTQPLNIYRTLLSDLGWHLGSFACKFACTFQATNMFVSTISITAIALDRFRCIVYPRISKQRRKNTVKQIWAIWLIALVLASPLAYFSHLTEPNPNVRCTELTINLTVQRLKSIYSVCALVFQYILPLIIVVSVYSCICLRVHNHGVWHCKMAPLESIDSQPRPLSRSQPTQQPNARKLSAINDVSANIGTVAVIDRTSQNDRPRLESNATPNQVEESDRTPFKLFVSVVRQKSRKYRSRSYSRSSSRRLQGGSQRRRRRSAPAENRRCKRTKTFSLLTGVAVLFALSWLPLNIVNIMFDFNELRLIGQINELASVTGRSSNASQTNSSTSQMTIQPISASVEVSLVQLICLSMVLTSACSNPVLYGWANRKFRFEFYRRLGIKRRDKSIVPV